MKFFIGRKTYSSTLPNSVEWNAPSSYGPYNIERHVSGSKTIEGPTIYQETAFDITDLVITFNGTLFDKDQVDDLVLCFRIGTGEFVFSDGFNTWVVLLSKFNPVQVGKSQWTYSMQLYVLSKMK